MANVMRRSKTCALVHAHSHLSVEGLFRFVSTKLVTGDKAGIRLRRTSCVGVVTELLLHTAPVATSAGRTI